MTYQKGHKHSEEIKMKISLSKKNPSIETRRKISLSKIGNKNMLGKHHTQETKGRISRILKEKKIHPKIEFIRSRLGKHHTQETKDKIGHSNSISRLGMKLSEKHKRNIGLAHTGEKHYNWQGGKSFEAYTLDWTKTLKRAIREKYNYTCQICFQEGFDIHHIDYNKKNCNIVNLVCLCRKCHMKTNFNRNNWIKYFTPELNHSEMLN